MSIAYSGFQNKKTKINSGVTQEGTIKSSYLKNIVPICNKFFTQKFKSMYMYT